MYKFEIDDYADKIGFQEHVSFRLYKSTIAEQLNRRYLYSRKGSDTGSPTEIKKIIDLNSSLRVDFGWSFESAHVFEQMMYSCIKEIESKYTIHISSMVSDGRCNWLGFTPLNAFEREILDDFSIYELLLYNNNVIELQTDVLTYISNHQTYLEHALLRDDEYRYRYYKVRRKDENAMSDAFHYYIQCIKNTTGLPGIPLRFIEEYIGFHFLKNAELFHELVGFHMLRGDIYEY